MHNVVQLVPGFSDVTYNDRFAKLDGFVFEGVPLVGDGLWIQPIIGAHAPVVVTDPPEREAQVRARAGEFHLQLRHPG